MRLILEKIKDNWRLFFSVFGVVFLSEMGDKTQATTIMLAGARPLFVWFVALGSAMALMTTSFFEVVVGSNLIARFLKPRVIKALSGVVFIMMGILLLTGVIGISD